MQTDKCTKTFTAMSIVTPTYSYQTKKRA